MIYFQNITHRFGIYNTVWQGLFTCQWYRSSVTGPALQFAGGSLPKSCSSLLIRFNAIVHNYSLRAALCMSTRTIRCYKHTHTRLRAGLCSFRLPCSVWWFTYSRCSFVGLPLCCLGHTTTADRNKKKVDAEEIASRKLGIQGRALRAGKLAASAACLCFVSISR